MTERAGTKEHVFPLAIGGRLATDRVCAKCNSTLGGKVDIGLADNFIVRQRRAELGLAGNSAVPPTAFSHLPGTGRLAAHPDRRVRVTFDPETGTYDTRAIYHAEDVLSPTGAKLRRISLDARDINQVPKIIQRERKRHGLDPLEPAELAAEVDRLKNDVETVQNPALLHSFTFDFRSLRRAMLKIAYELAFLWLGEAYLDDPLAAELRVAVMSEDPAAAMSVDAKVGDIDQFDVFQFWPPAPGGHLAFAVANSDAIAIAIRVFDVYAATVPVSRQPQRHLSGQRGTDRLRFLTIDAVTGVMSDRSYHEEIGTVARGMIGEPQPPFDSTSD